MFLDEVLMQVREDNFRFLRTVIAGNPVLVDNPVNHLRARSDDVCVDECTNLLQGLFK